MIPFNYHHLYYFYTIAQLGSVSRAAEKLRVGQPALSAQLKQFESYLGLKLFDREAKKLLLTEDGWSLLSYATDIFDTGREMMDSIHDRSVKGFIKIQLGVSSFIPKAIVQIFLEFLYKEEPAIHVSVIEDNLDALVTGLRQHALDLVLTDTPILSNRHDDIENRLLAKIPVVFCANPSLAKKYKKIPRDLAYAPLIMPTSQSQVYQEIQEYFISNKIKPMVIGEIQDVELVRRLVLAGIGIAPLNRITIKQAPAKEPLQMLGQKSTLNVFENIYLLTRQRKRKHPLLNKIIRDFKLENLCG